MNHIVVYLKEVELPKMFCVTQNLLYWMSKVDIYAGSKIIFVLK